MLTFGRLITAVVTPFHDDGSVDYDTFGRMVDGLIDAGNDAVVVTGTTGESPVLTETERMSLYREALNAADGRARVIAGTGGYNTSESIHLSRAAADVGVDGLLQVTPLLQQAAAGGTLPPLRGHRGVHAAAQHPLQRPGSHLVQPGGRHGVAAERHRQHHWHQGSQRGL